MPSLRQIRGRLRSIQSTKQIMRAMQLVSASKLKRAQGRLFQARDTLGFLDGLLERVLAQYRDGAGSSKAGTAGRNTAKAAKKKAAKAAAPEHPLCEVRTGASGVVIITSDTGLCGSYNTNLIQMAESYLRRDSLAATAVTYIGKKGYRYFTRRGVPAAQAYLDLAGRPNLAKADAIARALMEEFRLGSVASIHIIYARFLSLTTYRPTVLQWLPVRLQAPVPPVAGPRREAVAEAGSAHVAPTMSHRAAAALTAPAAATRTHAAPVVEPDEYIFEPSPQRVFEDLLPRWALAKFQLILLEAFTSEHSARMIAMKNATDNAEDLLKQLTRQRNKIRQAAITKEISEIVGTAEALK